MARLHLFARRFGHIEIAIGAVRNYRLTRLKTELKAIQQYPNYIGLERHQIRDAADFSIGVSV
jgi:hypothetical protein